MSSLSTFEISFNTFKTSVETGNYDGALTELNRLKCIMIDLDSLPPLNCEYEGAAHERHLACHVLEYAVFLAISVGNKESFRQHIAAIKPYYERIAEGDETETMCRILGLQLLYLLVENRLADFHCELELMSGRMRAHPAVTFCTQLEKHLAVGSYDRVLLSATNPPEKLYSLFLASLLETVRTNIGDCASAAYDTLSLSAATEILMFSNEQETRQFVADCYPGWSVVGNTIRLNQSAGEDVPARSEQIASMDLITHSLSYATELERIV